MEEATLTSKSQLTLPKAVRDVLGVQPGDRLRFLPTRNGFRIVAQKGDIARLHGKFKGRRSSPLSVDEMNEAIAQMGAQRSRGR